MRPLVLAAALLFASAAAQTPMPGYIVVEGDTLRGEITIGTETEAARGARFQAPGAPAPRDVGVEASAFGETGGRAYRRGRFPTEASAPEGVPLPRLGFARVVRDGAAVLLAYEPVPHRPVLLLHLDEETTGLFVVERSVETPRGLRRQVVSQFRQVLLGRLGGCGVEEEDVTDLSLTEADVARVVDAYNRCQDPGYAPDARARAAATRRPIAVSVEVGGGLSSSAFQRSTGAPATFDDPAQRSPHLRAAVEVFPWSRQGVSFRLGTEAHLALVRHSASGVLSFRNEFARDAVALSLGSRLTAEAAGTPVFVGVGVLSGVTRRRTTRENVPSSDDSSEGVVQGVLPDQFSSFGGAFLEAGVYPLGSRFGLGVEARTVQFSTRGVYLPGNPSGTDRYGLRSLVVTATARL